MLRFDMEVEIWLISLFVFLGLWWFLFCCNFVVLFLDNGKVLCCKYIILKIEIYEKIEWIIIIVCVIFCKLFKVMFVIEWYFVCCFKLYKG